MAVLECGEIIADASYTLTEFQRRTGMKRQAMRTAKANGLEVIHKHNRCFILGQSWLDYLRSQADSGSSEA